MTKNHGPTIKDDGMYEMLREAGASKEKAARIANAHAAGTLQHDSMHLENRSRSALYEEARRIGIGGRSRMTKDALIDAIRSH